MLLFRIDPEFSTGLTQLINWQLWPKPLCGAEFWGQAWISGKMYQDLLVVSTRVAEMKMPISQAKGAGKNTDFESEKYVLILFLPLIM